MKTICDRGLLLGLILLAASMSPAFAATNWFDSTTNWNNGPEMAATPSGWAYEHSPGYYFWLGMGFGTVIFAFGIGWRRFRNLDREDCV